MDSWSGIGFSIIEALLQAWVIPKLGATALEYYLPDGPMEMRSWVFTVYHLQFYLAVGTLSFRLHHGRVWIHYAVFILPELSDHTLFTPP